MLQQLINSLTDGFLLGFVYGLAAMGLSLIWGVMSVINLAHGPVITVGMLTTYLLFVHLGLNPYLRHGGGGGGGAGPRLADLRHRGAPGHFGAPPVVAVGHLRGEHDHAGDLQRHLRRGPEQHQLLPGLAEHRLSQPHLLAAPGGAGRGGASRRFLYLFLYFTRTGKAIRAVANNREAAELMGIPSYRMLALSFGLGSMLAAVAGSLISTIFPFTIFSGGPYELKSFVICVLGGLGNPLGALIGGLALGLMEGVIPIWMPTSWVPVVEFGLFVFVLVVKPSGLLGGQVDAGPQATRPVALCGGPGALGAGGFLPPGPHPAGDLLHPPDVRRAGLQPQRPPGLHRLRQLRAHRLFRPGGLPGLLPDERPGVVAVSGGPVRRGCSAPSSRRSWGWRCCASEGPISPWPPSG